MTVTSLKKYLLLLVILPFCVIAQPKPTEQDINMADEYLQRYKKASAVVVKAETKIEFKLDKSSKTPHAIESESSEFLSLRNNHSIRTDKSYDLQSSLLKASLVNALNKNRNLLPVCGNVEIDGIFYSDAQVCRYRIDFTDLGERLTLSTQKEYQDLKYFTHAYFQESFPIAEKKWVFVVPDWLTVEFKEINFGKYKITKRVTPDPQKRTTTYEFLAENLDAFKEENFAAGHSRTYPHLLVLFKSFEADGKNTPIINSVDDLYQWYHDLVLKVDNDAEQLEPVVKQLIADKKSDEEKIKAIYYWVQDNIRYLAFANGIAGFKPESASLVYQKKYGDCKGMANLTKEMLKIAGYDARLTWIGTSEIPYDYSTPSLAVDNHMICCVLLNGKKCFLDATEKFCPLNDYGERIQGRQVLIENGNQYMLDRVPVSSKERNHVSIEQELRIEDQLLRTTGKTKLNGEMKTNLLYLSNQTEKNQRIEEIKRFLSLNKKSCTIQRLEHTPLKERDGAFVATYEYTTDNAVSAFDEDLYVAVDQTQDYKDFILPDERVSDVDFSEKILMTSHLRLKLPPGYKLTHLPKELQKNNEDFSFHIKYTAKDGEIWYEKQITIDKGVIYRKNFAAWNECIKSLKQAYNDKIILTKIAN